MKSGISKHILFLSLVWIAVSAQAQADSARFDRPSLCLMMLAHPEQAFGQEIEIIFREMDMPERFNDHSLGVRGVKFPNDQSEDIVTKILGFTDHVQLPKKMVSKWFSRDKQTGIFSTDLIAERGLYNATKQDFSIAEQTIRGLSLLEDAGEKLISKTFLVLCDYSYNRTYSRESNDKQDDAIYRKDNRLSSFELTCTSYLFRLVWNDSVAAVFYNNYYTETTDAEKAKAFQQNKSLFELAYVGSCTDTEKSVNTGGQYSNQQLIKKTCVRLCDKNLTSLQHAHPEFRIKAPLVTTSPLKAYIGQKEGVTAQSRFEVLMPVYRKNGTYSYQRVGVIKPISGKIWDNRYMANEQENGLDATYFEQVSGGELTTGMLIREMD